MLSVPVVALDPDLALPAYARPGDAGVDLLARAGAVVAPGGGRALVPTGIRIAIPAGYAGFVQPRSGLALRHGITLANSPGLIDAGYRDELAVILINTDPEEPFTVRRGDRIAQLVIQAVEQVAWVPVIELDVSERAGGFGHTGIGSAELPEVEALVAFLRERAGGQRIERAEVAALSALKTYDPPISSLVGRTVDDCGRRGKYLCVRTALEPASWLVMHLSLGGWVQWRDRTPPARAKPGRGPLALRVGLSSGEGFDVTEQGTEKRLALWLVDDPAAVPGVARLGPDPLAADFDVDALARLLAGRNGNLKTVLVDQSVIAGVGNAYSDEALHAARLSPFKPAGRLRPDQVADLHAALVGVLRDALARSSGVAAKGLKAEKHAGMAVHGRTGQPCPTCGDTVREVSFATRSLQYCPTCQTGGVPLADRRLSRLLK